MGVGLAKAEKWTVKIETSVETRWVNTEDYSDVQLQGSEPGRTETMVIVADTKSDAMKKAQSLCYKVCDRDWVGFKTFQKDGKTYRIEQKRSTTNYYVVD